MNIEHSTSNKEKEMTNDEKSVKEHLSEIQKGDTQFYRVGTR